MVRLLTVSDLCEIIGKHGLREMIANLMEYLKEDFVRWDDFDKSPRVANHVDGGVIELMPVSDHNLYTFKLVNGHPRNPLSGKQTVIGTGMLCDTESGYPLLVSEMTVLTAIRTAAVSALASKYMARKDSKKLAIIGTGAQSDFQVIAHDMLFDLEEIRYYDTDSEAMERFQRNMHELDCKLSPCKDVEDAVRGCDIVIVVTACKANVVVLDDAWVEDGMHINGLGGDCPGKTEMDRKTVLRSRVVVEYFEQSFIEGEIQQFDRGTALDIVNAHLYQVINGSKLGRCENAEVTLFDSVGFALEDYSALRLVYDLAKKYGLGKDVDLIPGITNPKDLISVLPREVIREASKSKAKEIV